MRKEIVIPEKLIPALKLLAFKADVSVKKLMETIIIAYIKDQTSSGKDE